jgi:hypothetical protein
MTQDFGGYSSARSWSDTPTRTDPSASELGTGVSTQQGSTTEVAREEAKGVGESAAQAGSQVAQAATEQAKEVAAEARQQARDLLSEGRTQVRDQARAGQQRAASGLSMVADELRQMVDKGGQSGVASELARQASDRIQYFANWLEQREPGDLLDEARRWARQHPGAFLLGAALAGVVAGRLTGGVVAAQRSSSGGPTTQRFADTTTDWSGTTVPTTPVPSTVGAPTVPPTTVPPTTMPPSSTVPPVAGEVPPVTYPPPAYPPPTTQPGYSAGTGASGYTAGSAPQPPEQYEPGSYRPDGR